MPQPSCMCTVLLKLAKVERLTIRKFWVNILLITVINSTVTQIRGDYAVYTLSTISSYIHLCDWLNLLLALIHSKLTVKNN